MIWQCAEGILQLQGSLTQVLYSLDSKAMLADEILEELRPVLDKCLKPVGLSLKDVEPALQLVDTREELEEAFANP